MTAVRDREGAGALRAPAIAWLAHLTPRASVVAVLLLLALHALALHLMGQPAICTCGTVKLWEGVVLGPGNSQHLTDWYSFSHVVHGLLFYVGLWLVVPKLPVAARLLLALGFEIGWELFENTEFVIRHYREQALAQGYNGDSIVNSVSDVVMMVLGFVAAWRLPTWLAIVVLLALELFVGYMIRDNLTLNVINFIHPFAFIRTWQGG